MFEPFAYFLMYLGLGLWFLIGLFMWSALQEDKAPVPLRIFFVLFVPVLVFLALLEELFPWKGRFAARFASRCRHCRQPYQNGQKSCGCGS